MREEITFVATQQETTLDERRRRIARAVALGALGPGWRVTRDGDALLLESPTGRRARLTPAQRSLAWEHALDEPRAAFYAMLWAALVAGVTSLLFGWMWWWSVPIGISVGVAYAIARLRDEAREWRGRLRALVENLPHLE